MELGIRLVTRIQVGEIKQLLKANYIPGQRSVFESQRVTQTLGLPGTGTGLVSSRRGRFKRNMLMMQIKCK